MGEGKSGYDGKKVFRCISCGRDVLTTKFASALKVQCDDCKRDKLPPNQDILDSIKSDRVAKTNTVVHDDSIPDNKKKAKCVQCGVDILIGKFASAKTCLCDECKGVGSSPDDIENELKIDLSKLDRSTLPDIDQMYVMPSLISNRRLRQVPCPACGHEHMKIIKIVDASPLLGLVLVYQCYKCNTGVTISEQNIQRMKPAPMHRVFNYRGEEIHDMISTVQDTRMRNALEYMMRLCTDNGIDISGIELPTGIELREYNRNKGINKGWKEDDKCNNRESNGVPGGEEHTDKSDNSDNTTR